MVKKRKRGNGPFAIGKTAGVWKWLAKKGGRRIGGGPVSTEVNEGEPDNDKMAGRHGPGSSRAGFVESSYFRNRLRRERSPGELLPWRPLKPLFGDGRQVEGGDEVKLKNLMTGDDRMSTEYIAKLIEESDDQDDVPDRIKNKTMQEHLRDVQYQLQYTQDALTAYYNARNNGVTPTPTIEEKVKLAMSYRAKVDGILRQRELEKQLTALEHILANAPAPPNVMNITSTGTQTGNGWLSAYTSWYHGYRAQMLDAVDRTSVANRIRELIRPEIFSFAEVIEEGMKKLDNLGTYKKKDDHEVVTDLVAEVSKLLDVFDDPNQKSRRMKDLLAAIAVYTMQLAAMNGVK